MVTVYNPESEIIVTLGKRLAPDPGRGIEIVKDKFHQKVLVFILIARNDDFHEQNDKNYCLTKNMANYRTEKPINNVYMTDVEYDMENLEKEIKPSVVHLTTILNEGDFPQMAERTLKHLKTRSISYTQNDAFAVKTSLGISAPIPFATTFTLGSYL